jgi:hypothetical protein
MITMPPRSVPVTGGTPATPPLSTVTVATHQGDYERMQSRHAGRIVGSVIRGPRG